ncbi:MAG: hypothetical protein AAF244_04905 [Pseudomonadota bacterium]
MFLIDSTNVEDVKRNLEQVEASRFHFTNGTYAYPADLIVPTTIAGFGYLNDNLAKPNDAFVVAVNSDVSMEIIHKKIIQNASDALDEKAKELEENSELSDTTKEELKAEIDVLDARYKDAVKNYKSLEDQETRAFKVAKPLDREFPDRQVIIMFYDEETPTALYDALAENDTEAMVSLHKWGYGTDSDAPKIEGAHNFANVLAYPLPNDTKPVCYDITVGEDKSDFVKVVKLTEQKAPSGELYIQPPQANLG